MSGQAGVSVGTQRAVNGRAVLFALALTLNNEDQAVQLGLDGFRLCELLAPLRPHLNPPRAFPVSDQPIQLLHFSALGSSRCGSLGQ